MKSLTEGDYFGELALIYMAPRSASIKAVSDTHFWCITRGVFRQTVEEFVKKNYKTAKSYLSSISLLTFLT
jgi:CRP-like cAMP-binding protein